jgi:crotonobetainyl-CoA:carnitine CoA-transferase CaiB-like acyl-CoA transferase
MGDLPLKDVKVADFAWGVAGPQACTQLGNYGATVVKVESIARLDAIRLSAPYKDGKPGYDRSATYAYYNPNKRSMSLSLLKHPRGKEIARRLIAWADVVVESFRPGVFARWGFGYDELVKVKPDIIMLSSSSLGATGRNAMQPGLGNHVNGLAGLIHFVGFPDGEVENLSTAFTDYVPGPYLGASAVLGAIEYRNRTGKGQRIDLSQFETGLVGLAPELLDYTVNGRVQQRNGNRHRWAAPHSAYPAAGEDQWVAIEVMTDAEWDALNTVMGSHSLANDDRFCTFLARKQNEDALDEAISAWTRTLSAPRITQTLQAAGVGAGTVQTPGMTYEDPQLKARGQFWTVEHPVIGEMNALGQTSILSRTPAVASRPAPLYGEHTEFVARELLGMSEEEFVEGLVDGLFEEG